MKISTKGRYGLRALSDLVDCDENACVPLRAIAERHNISEDYLEQLLSSLKSSGIVTSVRGAKGGYKLSRAADDITVGEAIRALEGALYPVECIENDDYECPGASCKNCNTKPVWEKLYTSVSETLDSISLSDLSKL
ncbi:MAG: Rrf2 family transcriptional regulator [Turicibacter sp.]|nr:Rrf2 family transcriptional regulator [Turicibacter sp.]